MDKVIITLFNMSFTAVWLILAVIVLRLLLKKAPKYINLVMWALVGIRLVCPFTFESMMSIIPSSEPIPGNIGYSLVPAVDTGIKTVDSIVNPAISAITEKPFIKGYDPLEIFIDFAGYIWLAGIVILLVYSFVSFFLLKRKVRFSVRYDDNIYLCDNIKTPFILGIFKPAIYLPSDINAGQISFVIAHEKAHISRLDHIWKPLGFAVLCVHWFNPFVWFSYNFFCRDIEYACDEKVIKTMTTDEKKEYSETLLSLSTSGHRLPAYPLAFGEVSVKSRIKSVLSYKKPALWIIITAIVVLVAVAAGFMTNPVNESIDGYHYIDKYYYDEVIGEDRANNEMRDISYRIGEDMVLTKYFGTGQGNAITLGTLAKGNVNDYEIDLVLATLPVIYTKNNIKDVYGASFYMSDKYVFIMFKNGDFIGAYLPTDSNGNYYVMDSFKLKRDPDAVVESLSEFSEFYIPGTTTNEDVEIGIIELNLRSSPYVVIKWDNNTGDTLYYGTMYGVYRYENGEKIDCNTYEDRAWTTPLCTTSEKSVTRKFSLVGYDLEEPGIYTVEFGFNSGGYDGGEFEYLAVAEFYVEENITENEVPTSASVTPDGTTVIPEKTTTAVIIDSDADTEYTFNAKVIEVNDNNILVEPFEGENERKSASRIYVTTELAADVDLPELEKGSNVTIVYDGQLQETYPAQITNVYSITLHEPGR